MLSYIYIYILYLYKNLQHKKKTVYKKVDKKYFQKNHAGSTNTFKGFIPRQIKSTKYSNRFWTRGKHNPNDNQKKIQNTKNKNYLNY